MTRLSHSAMNKYLECPYNYKLHYIDKIREDSIGSALFFGSALDSAFGRLKFPILKCEIPEDMEWMEKLSAEEVFTKEFMSFKLNGEDLELAKTNKSRYYKSDYDISVFTDGDIGAIEDYAEELGMEVSEETVDDFMQECYVLIKNGGMDENSSLLFGYINWTSLYKKGLLLIEAYRQDILPQILKVHSIQEKIEITEGDDLYIGYIDYTCEFVDEPDVVYICDDKTSSKKYADDSVSISTQLSGYCEAKGIYKAAYTVVEKKLRKRDPRTRTQVVRDTIPEEMLDLTFDLIGGTLDNIADEVFPKAMDREGGKMKNCFLYGKMCAKVDYCQNGSMKGLVKLEKK